MKITIEPTTEAEKKNPAFAERRVLEDVSTFALIGISVPEESEGKSPPPKDHFFVFGSLVYLQEKLAGVSKSLDREIQAAIMRQALADVLNQGMKQAADQRAMDAVQKQMNSTPRIIR